MTINQPRLLQACKYTIITCALSHLLILAIYCLTTPGHWQNLNLFNVLGLNFLWPSFPLNVFTFGLGWAAAGGLVGYIYFRADMDNHPSS